MAISADKNYISRAVNDGLSIAQIAKCLRRSTQDLGQLAGDITPSGNSFVRIYRVKAMAKYKPQKYTGLDTPTDAQRASAALPYSINIAQKQGTPTYAEATASTFQTKYEPPTGSINSYPFRIDDFDGYCHWAPMAGMTCAVDGSSESVLFNVLAGTTKIGGRNASYICFYGFFLSFTNTHLKNRPFSVTEGIDQSENQVPNQGYLLNACIGIDDLFDFAGNNKTYRFGILLYKNDTNHTLQGFYPCVKNIADTVTWYTTMYQLRIYGSGGIYDPTRIPDLSGVQQGQTGANTASIENPESGTYTAVPALELLNNGTYTYYAMFRDGGYGAPFTFVVGGQDMYACDISGLSSSPSASTSTSLRSTANGAYITVKVNNVSYPGATTVANTRIDKFKLRIHVTQPSDATGRYITANLEVPSSGDITIPESPLQPTTLIFATQKISRFDDGDIPVGSDMTFYLDCELQFDGVTIARIRTRQLTFYDDRPQTRIE